MDYEILLGGRAIGRASVQRQGLYYLFDCRCSLSGESMFCISVTCGTNTENLGILVPEDGAFVLRTRLPVKRLGEELLRFEAVPKHTQRREEFIPLSPEEPFRYLQRLQNAYLQTRNGHFGVVLREPASDQALPDTPEFPAKAHTGS